MKHILSVALLFAAFASAAGLESQIVGKWTETSGKDKIEFKADGTFSGIIAYGEGGTLTAVTGTYFVADETTIGINLTSRAPMTWKVKLPTSDTLIVSYEEGGEAKLDRSIAKFQRTK